jgi:hypothetical protein
MGMIDRDWMHPEKQTKNRNPKTNIAYTPEQPNTKGYIIPSLRNLNVKSNNPPLLLLSVKMFLAEIRPWIHQYIEREYVCIDFAREVVKKATEQRMRCGLVLISFEKSTTGHAIIAFETDYGIIFFEPQTGDQIEIEAGKYYPIAQEGISKNDFIKKIDIIWNDTDGIKKQG